MDSDKHHEGNHHEASSEASADSRSSSDKRPEKKGGIFGFLGLGRHQSLSEDEIKAVVADNDELLEDEKRMIHEILDLRDMTVREIMKPRVDMMLVEDDETVRAALERMRGTGYSRLPVYHEDMDDIVGIVHFKDLMGPLMDGRDDEPVTKYMFQPIFVPETKDVIPLLSELQEQRQQMAIVVDEYGGTDGLITVEDIVEEIVGEIIDETDLDRDLVSFIGANQWRADGRFLVEDAQALGWPMEQSDDYETIAGWLMDKLDAVPKTGDEFEFDGYSFMIERMRRSRLSSIRVTRLEDTRG